MRAYVFADMLGRTLSWKGYDAHPRHQHHRRRPPDRRRRCGRGQAGEGGGRSARSRSGTSRGTTPRRIGPTCTALNIRQPAHWSIATDYVPADDRVRQDASPTSTATSSTAGSISTSRPSPTTAASRARVTDEGEGRIEAVEGKRHAADFAIWRKTPAGRDAPDGMGFAVGPRRAGLAPRMLGDERSTARLPVRHPHRRHRPPRDPPPERDRAEPGVLQLQPRRANSGARMWMHNNFLVERAGKMTKSTGEFLRAAAADRQGLSPARLPPDVPAGALPQRARVQLGRSRRGADAAQAAGDGGRGAQARAKSPPNQPVRPNS